MRKRELPPVSSGRSFLDAVKENIEIIMGRRGGLVDSLSNTEERWQDLFCDISAGRAIGANAPTWAAFSGGVNAYRFSATAMNEVWFNIHIPHDWKPGTKIYWHVHWSTTGTNTGVARWGMEYTLAKGHQSGGFAATATTYVEHAYVGKTGGNPTHMISEVSEADAIVSDQIEPDCLILCRLFRDGAHGNDTLSDGAFAFYVDVHYQSDGNMTTTRAPVLGKWTKNISEHANATLNKINEIIDRLQ